MTSNKYGTTETEYTAAEHENISSSKGLKKVGLYSWDETLLAWTKVSATGAVIPAWDYLAVTYPDADTEVYTFKSGGVSGTTTAVVTINYTDSTKEFILNVAIT